MPYPAIGKALTLVLTFTDQSRGKFMTLDLCILQIGELNKKHCVLL